MPARNSTSDTGPLKPPIFYMLLALAAGDTYGYALMQAVREASNGHVALSPGSFYRHLATLMADGVVVESGARRADDDPRRGTYYRLSARGHGVLADERRRLAAMVAAIDGLRVAPRRGHA